MDNHNHTKNTSHDTPTTHVHAENPEELLKLRLHKPSTSAAGITGVKVAVQVLPPFEDVTLVSVPFSIVKSALSKLVTA